MDKYEVAEILNEIATLLELKGENPFKTRAYTNGARAIEALTEPLDKIVDEGRLGEIKGFGKALQEKVAALVETGKLDYYDKLKASVPEGLVAMTAIPGLGPKKVVAIHKALGIDSLDALETACKDGQIAPLPGFGKKSETKIVEGIEHRRNYASRHHLDEAMLLAEPILDDLRAHPDTIRCSSAGSLRRSKETVHDVDFLVSSREPERIIDWFVHQPEVTSVLAQGDTKASVIIGRKGIQADLRVVSDAEFPSALAYFTGSKEHNIVMRQRAIERGLRLNEYGLFKSKEETRDPELRVNCATEEEIFRELELDYIPPELREDHGEFEAAENHTLPRLLEWTDLKGSLHNHSEWSDGRGTLREIADAMSDLGLSYWAITDHSKSSFQANGLDEKRLRQQIKAIAEVNQQLEDEGVDFRLLSGTEADIHTDGSLDFDDDLLAELDIVVASIHQSFQLEEKQMTERIIKAASNPHVHMIGHLTGRLLLSREAYKVNHQEIIDTCAKTGTWIELNASPYRLDMDWRHWRYAKSKGVKCVINCDAHRFEQAGHLRLGANVARKGWLTKEDVVNTRPLKELWELQVRD